MKAVKGGEAMDKSVFTNYTEKIYTFALSKTFSSEEAEELSQEILLTAISSLSELRNEERFEPWLWSLASNVSKKFRRNMSRQRAMYVYDAPDIIFETDGLTDSDEELYAMLRKKIAMLSKIYRDIIILYYYDELSTKEIAGRLEIPEGTVTWRLSEARRKLKKECCNMNETTLRPIKMGIGIYGEGNYNGDTIPFPGQYINDALSQNILYYCYDTSRNIEDLAKLCGVPAFYIEDRIDNLVKRCAVIQPVKGKYQADLLILTDKYGKYYEENASVVLMPVMDRLISALQKLYSEADKIDFYRGEKSENELKYLYGIMAFEYLDGKYSDIDYPRISENYDGNRWRYIANMESGKYHPIIIGRRCSANRGSKGTFMYIDWGLSGFKFAELMYDNYINVCEDILSGAEISDEESVAIAIKNGYIKRDENGDLMVTIPAFSKENKKRFDEITDEIFSPIMSEYSECVKKFIAGSKKLFPKHLNDDAQRLCHGVFTALYDAVLSECIKKGILLKSDKNWVCEVLTQYK